MWRCKRTYQVISKDFKQDRHLFAGDSIVSKYTRYDCYTKLWDAGFESSMEYSDRMMNKDQ